MAYKQVKITSWSFSRYRDYVQCPAKAKFKHVDKLKEPSNAAMERGTAIHKLAEDFVKGVLKKLPPELNAFKEDFTREAKLYKSKQWPVFVEDSWTLKADWTETQWNDWAEAWLRVKLDYAEFTECGTLVVVDHKTGKQRPDDEAAYVEQLQLYALAGLILVREAQRVKPMLRYLDEGTIFPPVDEDPLIYERADLDKLKKLWLKKTKKMLADTRFDPTPNAKCRWCHFRKSNGGPCQY
jgi:RecB family exonuclease